MTQIVIFTAPQYIKKQFHRLAAGFKVYGINKDTLPKILMAFPKNTAEQTKIAEILMKWDGYEFLFSGESIQRAVNALDASLLQGLSLASREIYNLLTLGISLEENVVIDKDMPVRQSFDLSYVDFEHPYEDRLKGKLPEDVCIGFIEKYSLEEKTLTAEIAELEQRIAEAKQTEVNVDEFLSKIKQYVEAPELTREMCYELIDKKVIGGHPRVTGTERVIDIVYKVDINSVQQEE